MCQISAENLGQLRLLQYLEECSWSNCVALSSGREAGYISPTLATTRRSRPNNCKLGRSLESQSDCIWSSWKRLANGGHPRPRRERRWALLHLLIFRDVECFIPQRLCTSCQPCRSISCRERAGCHAAVFRRLPCKAMGLQSPLFCLAGCSSAERMARCQRRRQRLLWTRVRPTQYTDLAECSRAWRPMSKGGQAASGKP